MRNVGEFLRRRRQSIGSVHVDQTVREVPQRVAEYNLGACRCHTMSAWRVFCRFFTGSDLDWGCAAFDHRGAKAFARTIASLHRCIAASPHRRLRLL